MIRTMDDLRLWCEDARATAQRALALYESGKMTFKANNVDITERQKASLRRIIADMDEMITRINADA